MTAQQDRQADLCQAKATKFPLTELQHAYWLGEQAAYRLHTPAYLYRCFFTQTLEIPRLETAILAVIRTHPSLLVEILADGTQRPLPPPESIVLPVNDLRNANQQTEKDLLADRKKTLERNLPPLGQGLQFSCFIDQTDEGYYVHFLFRLIAFDAQSMWLFLNDLCGGYLGSHAPQKPAAEFSDFVQQRQTLMNDPSYLRSLHYWQQRANTLPNAPELPMVDHDVIPEKSQFRRIRISFDAEQAARLHAQARRCGVNINSLLCTVYADVLRLWSHNPSFIINMLVSHRPNDDARFRHVYGNFGNTMPIEVVATPGGLKERARALQRQMFRDLKHIQVSGIEVIRAMRRSGNALPAMPVVFASSLGLRLDKDLLTPADLGWVVKAGGLQTPQVWLDCQVYMDGDQLMLNWDYVEEAFLPGVIEDMFAAFRQQLEVIQQATDTEDLLLPEVPTHSLIARQTANATEKNLPCGLLHDFFAEACCRHGNKPAIIAHDRTIVYADLWRLTTRLAMRLRQDGIGRNDLVAIVARRGWRQVAAAVAVIQAGGAYLPVASDLPSARKAWLIGQQGVKVVLVERALAENLELPPGVQLLILEDTLPDGAPGPAPEFTSIQTPQDLAYVIFTSGSTGQPKGVMIDHRGAVNTIQDVIDRFGLSCEDRVIGISAFNFDLSVYDIFGSLGTGAALVLPPYSETPSPEDWARTVREHQVTVWNTVPALLEMQLEFLGERASIDLASLRLVMLSGDWIPVSLPGRLASIQTNRQTDKQTNRQTDKQTNRQTDKQTKTLLVSLGGATEASIWSNYFIVDQIDPNWKSIPYGWPLANQSFHVLTQDMRPAPNWVPGELYIGGIGLAQGYYNDPQRTAQSFIIHPQTGERLYRTGDMGRYHSNGSIEFLGRNDDQVKIRGFRIELGEIDTVLARCPGIRHAATIVRQAGSQDRQLVALYVPAKNDLTEMEIRDHLLQALPDYMIPMQFVALEQIPVTANGKIDRRALADIAASLPPISRAKRAPRNADENRLAHIWQALLNIEAPGLDDNFFEHGGTSLLAVRLLNAIAAEFGRNLPLASLLRHGTIAAQAALLSQESPLTSSRSPLVVLREGEERILVVVHPVGGNVLCYRELANLVPRDVAVLGLQSPGDGSPRRVDDLAARYIAALSEQLAQGRSVYLLGWSMGGIVAQEMARQLEENGTALAGLTMIDSWMGAPNTHASSRLEGYSLRHNFVRDLLGSAPLSKGLTAIEALDDDLQLDAVLQVLRESDVIGGQLSKQEFAALLTEYQANYNALIQHVPQAVRTPTQLFRATRSQRFPLLTFFMPPEGMTARSIAMDEDHFSIFRGTSLRTIVAQLFMPLNRHDVNKECLNVPMGLHFGAVE